MAGDDDSPSARASTERTENAQGGRRALAPLLWAGAAVLAAHVPFLTVRLPALSLLRGPLGMLLLALAAMLALAPHLGRPRAWPGAGPLFLVTAAVYLIAGQWYTSRLRVSGDEPHYLLMAQSLWREGDLDLRDNHAREDWREYTPGPVAPHWGAPREDGRPHPAHSPALSLLLSPFYALGGRRACAALLGLMAALLTVQTRALALRLDLPEPAALLAWGLAAGPPVLFYSFHVYTEVPAALALAAALALVWGAPVTAGLAVLRPMAAAMLTVSLPWLHVKMMAAAAALAVVAAWKMRGRARVLYFVTLALAGGVYLAYFQSVYGQPSPLAVYGGLPPELSASPLRGLAGVLLDRSFGLLPHAPGFVLALASLPFLIHAWPRTWPVLFVGAAVVAPVLTWRMWWGGQSPAGRFLVPLVPLLGVAAASRVSESPRGLSRWAWPLVGTGAALALYAVVDPGRLLLLNRGDRPSRLWTALATVEFDLAQRLPSLVSPAPDWGAVAICAGALAMVLVLDVLALRYEAADRLFRSLGMPLLLGLGVLSALGARAG
jgi:hypothetical protein